MRVKWENSWKVACGVWNSSLNSWLVSPPWVMAGLSPTTCPLLNIVAKCLCGQVVNFLWTMASSFSPQIQIFLQLRKTFFSKSSLHALVGTASPWVQMLPLCSLYLPSLSSFLPQLWWVLGGIDVGDSFLVLPPTSWDTEGPDLCH